MAGAKTVAVKTHSRSKPSKKTKKTRKYLGKMPKAKFRK
jgi:hypothetical protein